MDSYMGLIYMSGLKFTPLYFMACNGQPVTISQNQALFSLLGTQFGGDGVNTFKLPDMRSVVPIGAGQQPGFYNYVQGTLSGSQAVSLSIANLPAHNHAAAFTGTGGGQQTLNIPAQTGNLSVTATPNLTASVSGTLKIGNQTATGTAALVPNAVLTKAGGGQGAIYGNPTAVTADTVIGPTQTFTGTVSGTVTNTVSGTASTAAQSVQYNSGITGGTVAVANTGSGTAVDVRQPALAISFIMVTQGTYPSRN